MALEAYKNFLHRCFRCGYCKLPTAYSHINCPSYQRYRMESYSPGGRLWLIRAVANKTLAPSRHYAHILYSCTMCGNCTTHCCLEFKDEILRIVRAAREELVEQSILPQSVQTYFENIYAFYNPWKKSKRKRGAWIKKTHIPIYDDGKEYLYYIGDIASYHPRVNAVCRALGQLFLQAGVSFGVLGEKEISDGNEVRDMGETGLFEYLMEQNMTTFRERGVEKIIAYSPHGFHAMKHYYKKRTGTIAVFHYLEILQSILSKNRINLSSTCNPVKVTYHDSCFLGRWNQKYDLPRNVLKQIPGIQLVEMERNKEDAFCCGGGNGNVFTDLMGGDENSPARIRVREALKTRAQIVAVSCPACLIMLEDAVESEGVGDMIKIMDVAEIVKSASVKAQDRQ